MGVSAGFEARQAAQDILSDVLRKHRPLEAALASCASLDMRDAGFARAIASETLRRLGQLEAVIRAFVDKLPSPHRAGPAYEILLAGACELLFLDVAAHAAVDGANRLAQADHKAMHFKPLINAVLRRVDREGRDLVARQDAPRLNTPDWMWRSWTSAYGEDGARAIASAHLSQAPLDIVTRAAGPEGAAQLYGPVWRFAEVPRVESLPGFAEGEFWVQDAAATLPARLLGDVSGRRVIDLCAAPGGKTAQLVSAGGQVTAVERDATRMARLADNLARLKLSAMLVNADVRDWQGATAPFVLLDAPCSATGTIRRHPELPWTKSLSDVTLHAAAAGELLDSAAEIVEAGGLLVFAVCSLEVEEGSEQVAHFLARNTLFRREAVTPEMVFDHSEFIDAQGDLRTLPSHLGDQGGMDGFFAARLRRVS